MHVVIVGCGRVGTELSGVLEQQGHSVAVIDKNPRAFRRLPAGFAGRTVVGLGFDRDDLAEAGLERCDVVVAATGDDED
ncbi:MAG: potassium channel family protein, partial [Actinomycetota bacterium]